MSPATPMPSLYVCGFMFSLDHKRVVLIRKNRPEWQRGRFNGVGGKINMDESAGEAMRREFKEEAGLWLPQWVRFAVLGSTTSHTGNAFSVHFFRAFGNVDKVHTVTDEEICIVPVEAIAHSGKNDPLRVDVIPNLRWLIPMALSMEAEHASSFEIAEIHWA